MNLSHNMLENKPCKMTLTKNSLFENALGYFSQRRNCLENRTVSIQYAANNPIEDRIAINQINDIQGYLLNVFDGHGGWQLAEYAMENLPHKFQKYLSDSNEVSSELGFTMDQIIIDSFLKAFDSIENGFLKIARKAKTLGLLKTGTVGSCALSVFVHDNKLYVANSGDCKGFLCSFEGGLIKCNKINNKLNMSSRSERERLELSFPDDPDICKKKDNNSGKFYLKNILQPTRAFGDYCLKHLEFYDGKHGKFNGPYMTHQPEIKIIELKEQDKFLILGSDGVWDLIKRKTLENILEKNFENIFKISENIFNYALGQICQNNGIQKDELMNMPLGNERRQIHDDISLTVVDLKNQFK